MSTHLHWQTSRPLNSSLQHAFELIARPSITPHDKGCQDYLLRHLHALGFVGDIFNVNGVSNLVARWGTGPTHFAFCGHTDVVPPGPVHKWRYDPFVPTIVNSTLYGRGAADMKTGVAAMLAACQRTLPVSPSDNMSLWFLITSDEEGEAEFGSEWIVEYLRQQSVSLDKCIIAEPTAQQYTGDTIRIGRRGSLSVAVEVPGKQGHVAYPHLCQNALHLATRLANALLALSWPPGSDDFPGTSLQITHIDSGSFVDNLAPGSATLYFNVRYAAPLNEALLKEQLSALIYTVSEKCRIQWMRPCEAYLTQPRQSDCLITMTEQAIMNTIGRFPLLSTAGGTSDGRFFSSAKTQVVEIGVPNASIHQIDEHAHLSDIVTLEDILADLLQQWLR